MNIGERFLNNIFKVSAGWQCRVLIFSVMRDMQNWFGQIKLLLLFVPCSKNDSSCRIQSLLSTKTDIFLLSCYLFEIIINMPYS